MDNKGKDNSGDRQEENCTTFVAGKKKPQKLTLTTFLTHPYIHSSNDESQAASTSSIIARKKK